MQYSLFYMFNVYLKELCRNFEQTAVYCVSGVPVAISSILKKIIASIRNDVINHYMVLCIYCKFLIQEPTNNV